MHSRKPVVGLAGGIGSGKSAVARLLEEMGAGLIDSDAVSRAEMENREVLEQLVAWWGSDILRSDGRVDRAAVARIVFDRPAERSRLEGLLHPRIESRRQADMARFAAVPEVHFIVIDAPLLYEVGLERACDRVIFVDAEPAVRLERVRANRGWSAEELARREASQMPLSAKRARADFVVENNSDIAALRAQVAAIVRQLPGTIP